MYPTLSAYIAASKAKLSDLAATLGCDPSFVSHIKAKNKPLPMHMAIRLYRKKGVKVGPIANATPKEIAVLERFNGEPPRP